MLRKRQLEKILQKQVAVIQEAENKSERDYGLMLCAGFLSGLLLTNAITRQEYNEYYDYLRELSNEIDAA